MMHVITANDRERDTILAALRFWQRTTTEEQRRQGGGCNEVHEHEIASESGDPLNDEEIDDLCEVVNMGPLDVKPPATTVHLMTREINGKRYGIGRCTVQFGTGSLDAVAVSAGDDRWVSTKDDCICWLSAHGLSAEEAATFVLNGLKAWDESHSIGIAK